MADNTTKTPSKISLQFIKGLEEYGLTMKQAKYDFKYIGGDGKISRSLYLKFLHKEITKTTLTRNSHLNYWLTTNPNTPLPDKTHNCICGHPIIENCYIENIHSKEILILGNCCINRFVEKKGRTCKICGASHKRRLIDRCFDCSVGVCEKCETPCNPYYKRCHQCHFIY